MKTFQNSLHIMHFSGNQMVQGPNQSFSAASKGFKRHQMMNKGLDPSSHDSKIDLFILSLNRRVLSAHHRNITIKL